MSKKDLNNALKDLLANSYGLYLKTQNYHWHVRGMNFKSIHEMLEDHYNDLADAIDEIAERIVMNGDRAPATFSELSSLSKVKEGDSSKDAKAMLEDLLDSHKLVMKSAEKLATEAGNHCHEGCADLATTRITSHDKMIWFISASLSE